MAGPVRSSKPPQPECTVTYIVANSAPFRVNTEGLWFGTFSHQKEVSVHRVPPFCKKEKKPRGSGQRPKKASQMQPELAPSTPYNCGYDQMPKRREREMAKPWQPPTARISAKSRSFPEVVRDIRYCVWSINRFRPDPPGQDTRFFAWNLGSGFFVAPKVFLTCHHVVNSSKCPHQTGDRYQLVQNLLSNTIANTPHFIPVVGTDLHLYPDRDAAVFQIDGDDHPYVPLGYNEILAGQEIGVAGYPLPRFVVHPTGNLLLSNLIYRVAKGVVTSTVKQSLTPASEAATAELNTIEVNFLFVPGNSGGPIFDAETGRVLAYVHGFMDSQIVQRYSDTIQENITAGAPPKHIQSLHAVYSLGIRLDAMRTELDGFGAVL